MALHAAAPLALGSAAKLAQDAAAQLALNAAAQLVLNAATQLALDARGDAGGLPLLVSTCHVPQCLPYQIYIDFSFSIFRYFQFIEKMIHFRP